MVSNNFGTGIRGRSKSTAGSRGEPRIILENAGCCNKKISAFLTKSGYLFELLSLSVKPIFSID